MISGGAKYWPQNGATLPTCEPANALVALDWRGQISGVEMWRICISSFYLSSGGGIGAKLGLAVGAWPQRVRGRCLESDRSAVCVCEITSCRCSARWEAAPLGPASTCQRPSAAAIELKLELPLRMRFEWRRSKSGKYFLSLSLE